MGIAIARALGWENVATVKGETMTRQKKILRAQVSAMLGTWIHEGRLVEVEHEDENQAAQKVCRGRRRRCRGSRLMLHRTRFARTLRFAAPENSSRARRTTTRPHRGVVVRQPRCATCRTLPHLRCVQVWQAGAA